MSEGLTKFLRAGGYGLSSVGLAVLAFRRRSTPYARVLLSYAVMTGIHSVEAATVGDRPAGSRYRRAVSLLSASAVFATGVMLVASLRSILAFPSGAVDALTQLPNRYFFDQVLARTLREIRAAGRDERAALLFVDLDNFKAVNDRHGHHCGDRVLIESAKRLREFIQPPNVAARVGGDEFAVLITRIRSEIELQSLVNRVEQAFGESYTLADQEVFLGASVGATLIDGSKDAFALMRAADESMYVKKQMRRSRGSSLA